MVSQDVDVSSARAEEAASKVIDYINGLTSQHREKCSVLHLDKILSVRLLAPNEQVLKYFNSMDADQRIANFTSKVKVDIVHYQITLVTSPSNAMYESTLQYNIGAERLEVTPDISRINIYGNQPYCVQKDHPDLRKYCFCADYQSWEKRKKKLKHD
ncbi:uncharacterized protein LOC106164935 [Lingula anatina]|uniref:Uncharacterized protein LOC106164935 n=1 Tax=Lingula anatina TaxID=7574 RepID=A0A1S3ILP4_LINAN|nr:uncharacterized protein LOC106164935 [Lingula anatina]|eukprot:XP_013398439.1 uncharacterized protein LOC106164935 [Lingula anatina]